MATNSSTAAHAHLEGIRVLGTFTFAGQKFWAFVILALAVGIVVVTRYLIRSWKVRGLCHAQRRAAIRAQRHGGLVMGFDGRLSTSKAIATLWTLIVAYFVVALALVALTQTETATTFQTLLSKAPDDYLLYLGPPYAAAVLSKVAVTTYTSQGLLQKLPGSGQISPTDIISDDQGNTNLYDFQYTLFNLIAALIVLVFFLKSPGGSGFPPVPDFLAILTGGSALTYTVSKGANFNGNSAPTITAISPTAATANGTPVTIFGSNFLAPSPSAGEQPDQPAPHPNHPSRPPAGADRRNPRQHPTCHFDRRDTAERVAQKPSRHNPHHNRRRAGRLP